MKVAKEIERTVEIHAQAITVLSEEVFSFKVAPGKWSPREIIGHLTDSAQNNIQRFVRAQYEDTPRIVYAQDEWVRLQGYQHCDKEELIRLWVSINRHLCRILVNMDPSSYERKCDTGNTTPELHTLSFLAEDYLNHLVHHLDQMKERIKISKELL